MKAKLAFISAHGSTYSIRLLCSVLGVARSWFHDWQAGDPARAAESCVEADLVGHFAGGLKHDLAAVKAALSLSWSTGPVKKGRSTIIKIDNKFSIK